MDQFVYREEPFHNRHDLVPAGIRRQKVDASLHGPGTWSDTFTFALASGLNRVSFRAVNLWHRPGKTVTVEAQRPALYPDARLHILAVGIDAYPNATSRLAYASSDAARLAETLHRHGAPLYGNVRETVLQGEQASRPAIRNRIRGMIPELKKEDLFVFFFAGHGVLGRKEQSLLLFPAGTNPEKRSEQAPDICLPVDTLAAWMDGMTSSRLVLIDACFSGNGMDAWNRDMMTIESGVETASSTAVLAAAGPDEYAREAGRLQQGVFTRAMIEALQGRGAPSNRRGHDKLLQLRELADYVQWRVPVLCDSLRLPRQTPHVLMPDTGFPVIARTW
jgi:hypothetical protein